MSSTGKKMSSTHMMLGLAAFGIIAYFIYNYSSKKSSMGREGNVSGIDPTYSNISGPASLNHSEGLSSGNTTQNNPVQNPSDLLPKGQSQWSNLNPSGKGELENINMLNAGYFNGKDTISSSLRNANLQIRSEPPNPRNNVGPWNNSTISGNPYQVPLELGQGGL